MHRQAELKEKHPKYQ